VKIYYTIRELTNYTTELWALRSLGDEILGDCRGGGYPWLREHLVSNYRPQWYQWFPDKSADASVVNAPGDSRWYNYYIEGLKWLVENVDIDGLYLDDVSYDRRTVKRIRKVLDNTKPGCMLDLHSNTGFSKGPATQYTEFFPYMDKLWFGESFMYSQMPPENWLVEVSGIPFGLMGDMLHGGGNRWLGMVYGMTVRHPWVTEGVTCDPRPVWKVWDEFGIEQSQMVGFWEKEPVVLTNNSQVKATAYIREGKTLIALGNWSDKTEKVQLNLDWNRIGFSSVEVKLIASEIADFQPSAQFAITDEIPIESKKGWLLIIEEGK
ncbi:MAG: glycoside hydrolase domain-containing protein, partial [Draconibacterium sp.]